MTMVADRDEIAMEHNRQRLIREFEREVARLERRYELPSRQIRAALDDGRLQETAEVASWLLLLEALVLIRRREHSPAAQAQ